VIGYIAEHPEDAIEKISFCARCMGSEMNPNKMKLLVSDISYAIGNKYPTLRFCDFIKYCENGAIGEYGKNYGFNLAQIINWIKAGLGDRKHDVNDEYMMASEKIGLLKKHYREMVRNKGVEYCENMYPTIHELLMSDPPKKRKSGHISVLVGSDFD
jgi:hypothetical protein